MQERQERRCAAGGRLVVVQFRAPRLWSRRRSLASRERQSAELCAFQPITSHQRPSGLGRLPRGSWSSARRGSSIPDLTFSACCSVAMMAPLLSVAHVVEHGRRTGCSSQAGLQAPWNDVSCRFSDSGSSWAAPWSWNGDDHGATGGLKAVTTPSVTRAPSSLRPIATWFGPSGTSPAPSAPFSFRRPAGLATAPSFPQTEEARVATICSALKPAEWSSGSMKVSSSPQAACCATFEMRMFASRSLRTTAPRAGAIGHAPGRARSRCYARASRRPSVIVEARPNGQRSMRANCSRAV